MSKRMLRRITTEGFFLTNSDNILDRMYENYLYKYIEIKT